MSRKMKDSGVEWIGEIPEDWEVGKIGQIYKDRNIKVSDIDYMPLSVTKKGIVPQLESAAKTDNGDNRKLIKKNDFVINSRSDRRGSCGISNYDGSCSLINTVLEPKDYIHNGYYNYLFRSELFADEFYKWGSGIVEDLWSTKWSRMKRINIPVPSIHEQKTIDSYLNNNCSHIDHIITKTQASIEEYKRYKQSIITEAVTKGLDPNVPMKDSGIEWIGEIPEHWRAIKSKTIFDVTSGSTPKSDYEEYWEGNINWVTPSDYKTDDIYITSSNRTLSELGLESCGTSLVPKGSIIISNRAPIGSVCVAGIPLCTNQGCKSLVKKSNIVDTKYYYYYFSIMNSPLNMLGRGVTFLELSTSDLKAFVVPNPPYEEQRFIVEYLDHKITEINQAMAKKKQLINNLESYKKSLIYEVVTGKKEVI